jgi:hypothetical protein
MVKRRALIESISSNVHNFLKETGKNLSLTDKKFLRDGLVGLLRAGQPIVCQMALPNQRTKFVSRLDRLDQHLEPIPITRSIAAGCKARCLRCR